MPLSSPFCSRFLALLFGLVVMALGAEAALARQGERVLLVRTEAGAPPLLEARVNGEPVRLLLAPDAPRFILLNPGVAERLRLRANPLLSLGVRLDIRGDVSRGRTGRASVTLPNGGRFRQRVIWMEDIAFSDQADGVIGVTALEDLDLLIIQIDDPDRSPDIAMTRVRLEGDRGLEWTFRSVQASLPVEIRFSFSRPSSLDTDTRIAFENRGLISPASEDLSYASFWFLDRALAFEHRNLQFDAQGLRPDRFLRFAQAEDINAHHARLEYERAYGPIDTITVRSVSRRSPYDPYGVSLGEDVLNTCWRVEFDFEQESVLLRCPVNETRD